MKTFLLALLALVSTAVAADKIKVLIVDGQNNHDCVLPQVKMTPGSEKWGDTLTHNS